jgi:hypothetical protein
MQHACPQEASVLDSTEFVIQFKNDHAQRLFQEELHTSTWNDLLEVLRVTAQFPAARGLEGNIFEPVVHQILPGQDSLDIHPMQEKHRNGNMVTYERKPPPSLPITVRFRRSYRISFSSSPPANIDSQNYYQAARNTPLIDGFIVQHDDEKVQLYFIQISVSQQKKSKAPSGPQLVCDIAKAVKKKFLAGGHEHKQRDFDVHFVLIHPSFSMENDPTWQLPSMALSYKVYHVLLGLPTTPPAPLFTAE